MRLGLKASNLLERVADFLNLAPQPLAHAFFGMMASRTLMAGARLGVYAALADGAATAEALAARLKTSTEGMRALLEALIACEVVELSRGRFRLAPRARRWLDPRSPQAITAFLEFNYAQWDWWGQLENAVKSGQSVDIHQFAPDDPRWRDYIQAMYQLARLASPEVAAAIPLPRGARHLLDLGGAHGWYAAELCRMHRGLKATVVDLEGSVRVGRDIIAQAGMSHRVTHKEGDVLHAELGGPYDGVLLFQVMHHLTPAQNVALLRRVRGAMVSRGTLAVLEYLREERETESTSAPLIGLHYFLTSGAASYTPAEVEGFLDDAGFKVQSTRPIRHLPLQTLIIAQPD
ncbi:MULTISPECIES: class I SAM-dependent methyltransferase [unclassified Corallococcus]|uniref:class I SAM-dependent methyltransferase n=1 Tax=unclassified Corallococcus TaxID=2685029 RepID=UPI001A8D64FD|nr:MULTISPECIES: class I SAM-dependent methyltransferase [unclassified Corallococcus]MBN9682301.1 methyltransferase [Corallococcus sp. NCSPR001]WAS86143.1 methyltransferase [Corallococcus sp. NCRR]